jgi:hypothetical protein
MKGRAHVLIYHTPILGALGIVVYKSTRFYQENCAPHKNLYALCMSNRQYQASKWSRAAHLLAPLTAILALALTAVSHDIATSALPACVAALTVSLIRVGGGLRFWDAKKNSNEYQQVQREQQLAMGAFWLSVVLVPLAALSLLVDNTAMTVGLLALAGLSVLASLASTMLANRARRAWWDEQSRNTAPSSPPAG